MSEPSDFDRPAPPAAHVARFVAAIGLLVAISLVGVAIDNRELALRRRISLDTFRADQLEARAARLRFELEERQTPQRLRAAFREEAAGPAAIAP
ncbi:MAG: hypothetical protein KF774_10430 [Planctomyces sp.]|nr:hypothetical protein [Planctomyces sp.]